MNARQMKKCLKKQVAKLQSDNDLMQRIIADTPEMQYLYDAYNKPFNATLTTLPFQEFNVKRTIPVDMAGVDGIKDNITYEIESEHGLISITGSIFIGRMWG